MATRDHRFARYVLVTAWSLLGGVVILVGLFLTWGLYLSSRFPFEGSGGFRDDASVFTVGLSGRLSRHRVCVAPALVPGPAYFLRVGGTALERQLAREPFLFYEGDAGSGVSHWCAFPLTDDARRDEATRVSLEYCDEPDGADFRFFELQNRDACV
jgi:hypothetical protein